MTEFIKDRGFWKKLAYHERWKPHAEVTKNLMKKIEDTFPNIGAKAEHGADTDKELRFLPEKKEQPDIILVHKYEEKIGYIHVSVPQFKNATGIASGMDVWVLELKFLNAPTDKKVWFYFVYPNITLAFDYEMVEKYKNNVQNKVIKYYQGNPVSEKYICIPFDDFLSDIDKFKEEVLFNWIKEQIETD